MKTLKKIGELALINIFKKKYKTYKHTIIGIGDDSAVIESSKKGEFILFTCDTVVEGTHFRLNKSTAFQVGWKAMGAGISDIAAMGGKPKCAVVSMAMPSCVSIKYVNDLIKGMAAVGSLFGVDIVGGDTVSSHEGIIITVSVIGDVKRKNLVLRSGAKVGDKILVTGVLGGSILKKQFNFIPRINESNWIVNNAKIHSMMDITDGLSLDLHRIASASKVGALLNENSIPISKDALKFKEPLQCALNDGEDFELLFTMSDPDKLLKKWPYKDVKLTVIGEITKRRGLIEIIDKFGVKKQIHPKGYEHFK
jgi:thiamine-monophosphate kinase